MSWNPDQYEQFKAERAQPFHDLVALIHRQPGMRVLDLGCGTGELTRQLHEQLGAAETLGIDNSETMLLKSGAFEGEMLRFEKGDIEAFVTDRPYDLIFSNAALHWLQGHDRLIARLTSFLSPHGQLAIQMPDNASHGSHVVAGEVAQSMGVEPCHYGVLPVERYAELLHHLGYRRQHVRLQVYGHVLPSSSHVVEWVKGSLLSDYRARMPAEAYERFLSAYTERLLATIGDHSPYFYTYKRLLIWGEF
jgi:trans-aconitate 2-methyltransferase